jgi:hypothetical protein
MVTKPANNNLIRANMFSKLKITAAALLLPLFSFGWGSQGHQMVAEVARKNLDKGIEAKVQQYLDTFSFAKAATWMDELRNDRSLDYMKPWHYVNIDPGKEYKRSPKGDATFVLDSIITELRNYKNMKAADVQRDLKILFHLCGDITQPLHVGYGSDLGGNKVKVSVGKDTVSLHSFWDSGIIKDKDISLRRCTKIANGWSKSQKLTIGQINPTVWMYDSRELLVNVYNFKNKTIQPEYLDWNKEIIETQIAKGGIRLAAVLNDIFK